MSETPKYDLWVYLKRAVWALAHHMKNVDVGFSDSLNKAEDGTNLKDYSEQLTDFTDIEKELGVVMKYGMMANAWIELKKEEEKNSDE